MRNVHYPLAALAAGALLIGSVVDSMARPARINQIPNGTVNACANCHVSPGGGGARDGFGQEIGANFMTQAGFAGQVIWGPELAALDSDGDGATNGEELGDPEGLWTPGDTAGDPEAVTDPSDPESFPPPPPEPTAVEATGWGQVKQSLLE